MAERTGCLVFCSLWPYLAVVVVEQNIYVPVITANF